MYLAVNILENLIYTSLYRSKECSQFNINLLDAESLDDLQRDINDVEKVWVLYEDFHSQLDEMKSQDWISFRSVLFADLLSLSIS